MLDLSKFRLSGASNPMDEPHTFLNELHAVLCCIEHGFGDEDGDGRLNREILCSALQAAQTLTFLVGADLQAWDDKRGAGNA